MRAFLLVALCLFPSRPAGAHNGPPFPIIEAGKVGPFVVSLWTHPDIGIRSVFFVIIDPPAGQEVPSGLRVRLGVRPESGRLPEKIYETWRDPVRNHVQYDNDQIEFDQQELWRVRLVIESSIGGGEALSRVEPTPVGLGRADLALYASPFLVVAAMWYRGLSRVRARARGHVNASTPVARSGEARNPGEERPRPTA